MTFRSARVAAATLLLFVLAGCEVPVMIAAEKNQGQMSGAFEITFPAAMYVQTNKFDPLTYTGTLIGKANGASSWHLTHPELGVCTGHLSNKGKGHINCDTGVTLPISRDPDERIKMSGIEIIRGTTQDLSYKVAFGWGNMGNVAAVQAAALAATD